ncbi:MAG: SPOR domain-containing protein [Alphaproteobacteria bacterium]|nr:SPOR domain-containing protein [Alphaproteobacteria bacterium]
MKELFNNPKEEEYLSEFKQKIAQEMEADILERRHDLERSRNGFIGAVSGIVLAGLVSWFLLLPQFGFNQEKEIPVIRRPILQVKIRPNEPGGMDIQNQDKAVYALVEKNEVVNTKIESLLPPPEVPQMPDIETEEQTLEPAIEATDDAQTMDELINAVHTTATEKVKIPEKLPVIDVTVVKTDEPLSIVKEEQTPEKPTPKAQEKSATQIQLQPQGTWCVQMMASSKKEAVEKGYIELKKQHPFIANLPYRIEVHSDGLTRLKVGAYALKSEAEALCQKIKSAGGTCILKEK